MTITMTRPAVSPAVAAEIRAVLGRQGVNQRELADRIGKPQIWISRRLGKNASVGITVDEVAEMADALGVEAEGIVLAALRACRDSNPKPSDPWAAIAPNVNRRLTTDRRYRSAWGLAA